MAPGEDGQMGNRPFTLIAAILFGLAALLHLYRLFTHFQVILGSHTISQTVSIVAIVVAAILSWGLFRESRRLIDLKPDVVPARRA
jgi:hypothetical protein